MVPTLLATGDDPLALALRLVLAGLILPHGAQKLLGWFGGYGWHGTMGYFRGLGIPAPLGAAAILAESAGAVALAAGAFTRLAALGIAVNMLVAAWMVHRRHGFFANWFGTQEGEGYEYHLVVAALAGALVWLGGGAWSVDRLLAAAF